MGGILSRGSTNVVPVAASEAEETGAGPSSAGEEEGEVADRARADAAATARKALGVGFAEGAAAADEAEPLEEFEVGVRSGNGSNFKVVVHEQLTVEHLHAKISRLLGPVECPLYAIRLIYKTRVLSHRPDETLAAFGIAAGAQLQLVVVRDMAHMHASHRTPSLDAASEGLRTSSRRSQVRDGAAPKVELPVAPVHLEPQKSTMKWTRRASWDTGRAPAPRMTPQIGGLPDKPAAGVVGSSE